MKNGITLLIASVLLVLCVMQKQARYGGVQGESVEKMYNSSPIAQKGTPILDAPAADDLLTDSRTFEFASADSTSSSEPTAGIANQRLLHISASSKMLNY
ncbi:hypothetical protein LZD49_19230 [Dyadobacter sp. CY261]|uniref:hypothetical protein n=1 Tax=Dyadobacter sp. CY261 TaxID=2907203 RepID=UPI001F22C03A|nr:hypothetical protein [Dyadobacter sp. CY261]MCF0072622.1 hypothetical protein [Dyadobacter sp. CY261]